MNLADDSRAQTQSLLEEGATQIKVTILQTHLFGGQLLRRRVQLEGRRARLVEDEYLARLHLHVAGRELRVALPFLAQHYLAAHGDDVLAAHLFGARVRVGRVLGVEDDLRQPVAVAQVYEGQRPEVAAHRDPAHQHDFPPRV